MEGSYEAGEKAGLWWQESVNMTEEKILKLISLAKEKNKLLDNIIQITKRQEEEIQEERYEDLNKSLKEKDSIINKINKLDRVFLETFHSIKRKTPLGI